MSGTWNGIGTKFYGSKDQDLDNSFVTTEWFVLFYFPVLPIGSKRVIYLGSSHGWRTATSKYLIIEKIPLDWHQVISTYLVAFGTVAFSLLMAWGAGKLFTDENWQGLAILIGFLLPIFISMGLFLNAKPAKNVSDKNVSEPPPQKPPEINIAKIPKPQITPPSTLSFPDLKPLDPLLEKYSSLLSNMLSSSHEGIPEWIIVKKALDDALLLNFETISAYMNNVIYKNIITRDVLEQKVKTATTTAACSAWIIGLEWAQKDPGLKAKFSNKTTIEVNEIPFDAMQLLAHTIYFPYFVFASIFTDYYDSEYGKNTRYQRDGHLKDTYQAITKGVLACFLMGVRASGK